MKTPFEIIVEICDERDRAVALRDAGKFEWTPDQAGCPNEHRLAVLVEEVGEVAQAALRGDVDELRAEVAAVTLAWLDGWERDAERGL